jgi:hypothetical protein
MQKTVPDRRERGPQATLIGCADARLTGVVRQCRQTRPPYLGEYQAPGIGRTRTDGLWHRIAVRFKAEQSNEPKQDYLRYQNR